MAWATNVFALELRRLIAYRLNFWVQTLASVLVQFVMAYYLWRAIYEYRGAASMGGYSFPLLMLYYILVGFLMQIIRGPQFGHIWREIYDGSLTRYLIYPLSFFGFKFVTYLAFSFLCFLQLLAALAVYYFVFGGVTEAHLGVMPFVQGLLITFVGMCFYFLLSASIEALTLWADSVWSLLEMLRYISNLMGGALIPIVMFPQWGQKICYLTPFPYLFYLPAQTFLGLVGWSEWLTGLAFLILWCAIFAGILQVIWQRGLREYTGVGI